MYSEIALKPTQIYRSHVYLKIASGKFVDFLWLPFPQLRDLGQLDFNELLNASS
jgi:hypothetical protein